MNLRKISKEIKLAAGGSIGYELYAKGLDRIQAQTKQLNIATEKLAKLVRSEDNVSKRKRLLKDVEKWSNFIKDEVDMLKSDVSKDFDGYKTAQLRLDNKVNGLDLPTALLSKLKTFGIDRSDFVYKDPMSGSKPVTPQYLMRKINQASVKMDSVAAIYGNSGIGWFLAVQKSPDVWDFYDEGRISTPRFKNVNLAQGARRLSEEPYELWFLEGGSKSLEQNEMKLNNTEVDDIINQIEFAQSAEDSEKYPLSGYHKNIIRKLKNEIELDNTEIDDIIDQIEFAQSAEDSEKYPLSENYKNIIRKLKSLKR